MRVLVVEDHLRMAALIREGLRRESYAVDTARTGEGGVRLASANDYDAVVLDLVLPDVDGYEVLRRIRAQGRWTPVLVLTARDAVDDRVRGLDAGADDYLTKPFAFAELLARLRAMVRRDSVPRPTVLSVGDLTLDPAGHEVRRGDTVVPLTAKEFALLHEFMRRPGAVLSRQELLEHAWDVSYEGDSNVVDVYVRYLREKVDRPFGRRSLETVRGLGYRLRIEPADAPDPH
jgi:two-component system OmpR family response regulator